MEKAPVQSIDRALDIIELLAKNTRGVGLTDIASAVGLHKSTVHRMLSTLVARKYAVKDAQSNKYRLTMRMFALGSRAIGGNLLAVSRTYVEKLSDLTAEVVHVVVRDDDEVVYLYKADASNNVVRIGSQVGLRNPIYCTAVGKSILALLPWQEVEAFWSRIKVERFTEHTITTLAALREELRATRERGYAVDNEEHEPGVMCVSAAISDYSAAPVGAISVSVPTVRMDSAKMAWIAAEVMAAAAEISTQLGYGS